MEKIGDTVLFQAGPGEWYNQPHKKRWDMGEDAAEIPPAGWHIKLEESLTTEARAYSRVVLDLREMDWLVGQDWGFLYRLGQRLTAEGQELAIVASSRVTKSGNALRLDEYMRVYLSIEESLPDN